MPDEPVPEDFIPRAMSLLLDECCVETLIASIAAILDTQESNVMQCADCGKVREGRLVRDPDGKHVSIEWREVRQGDTHG